MQLDRAALLLHSPELKTARDTLYWNLITVSSVSSKKKQIDKKNVNKMSGTLFSSTIDPLLIHLPCPFWMFRNYNMIALFSGFEGAGS